MPIAPYVFFGCPSWGRQESNLTAEASGLQPPWRTSARHPQKRKKATPFGAASVFPVSGSGYPVAAPPSVPSLEAYVLGTMGWAKFRSRAHTTSPARWAQREIDEAAFNMTR